MTGSRPSRRRLVALVAAVVTLGVGCSGLPGQVTGPLTLTATFDDVGDLVVGHSVQIADVRVGSVTGIELTDDFRARVTMSVRDVGIPAASEAVLRTTSLLGEKFIELRPLGDPTAPPFLSDGDEITRTREAPELEFVAETAIGLLGAVAANDLAVIIDTGAVGFGGRGPELRSLIEDLATVTRAFADHRRDLLTIIDRMDEAAATLADGSDDIDGLLVNLAETTGVLAAERDRALAAITELTRLAEIQNTEVLDTHRADIERQIRQLDAIVSRIAANVAEVELLVDWAARFTVAAPRAVPGDFAQLYAWFATETTGP